MSVLRELGVRNQSILVVKYDLLEFLSGVLEMSSSSSSCDASEDLYAALASTADAQEMLFDWCITIDQLPNTFTFNEKYVPAYFDLFARMYVHAPGLYLRYAQTKCGHLVWVVKNILFSEHFGRPHPVARDACCRFYDQVLARPQDRGLFLSRFFDFVPLKSKPQDVLWVLHRFFGEGAPSPLPDSAYATAGIEKRGLSYAVSHLSPGKPEAPAALRVAAAFLARVAPADAAQAARVAEALFALFAACAREKAMRTASTGMQTEEEGGEKGGVDEAALMSAWEGLLARSGEYAGAIVHALRGFLVAQQHVLRVNKRHWDELGAFAESVRKLLTTGGKEEKEGGGEEESLCVAFLVAVLCGDEVCGGVVEREATEMGRLPKLTRDEIMALCRSMPRRSVDDCELLCGKMPYCLDVYGRIVAENVNNCVFNIVEYL